MFFVYFALLGVIIFTFRQDPVFVKISWVCAAIAWVLTVVVFLLHAISPLEVHL